MTDDRTALFLFSGIKKKPLLHRSSLIDFAAAPQNLLPEYENSTGRLLFSQIAKYLSSRMNAAVVAEKLQVFIGCMVVLIRICVGYADHRNP